MVLSVALTSCRHAAPTGNSSFTLVNDFGALQAPASDASELKIVQAMSIRVAPKAIPPLTLPKYPASALAAHLLDIQYAVTITIDTEGRVIHIERSYARLPYTSAFRDEFVAAIEQAVATWKFEPGKLAHLDPQENERPLVTGSENAESKLTVAFCFTQSGKAQLELAKH